MATTIETSKTPNIRLLQYEARKVRKFAESMDASTLPSIKTPAATEINSEVVNLVKTLAKSSGKQFDAIESSIGRAVARLV
jgi:hypothetical protein